MYFCSSRSAQSLVCLLIFIMSWTIKQREWSEMLHLRIKWEKKKKRNEFGLTSGTDSAAEVLVSPGVSLAVSETTGWNQMNPLDPSSSTKPSQQPNARRPWALTAFTWVFSDALRPGVTVVYTCGRNRGVDGFAPLEPGDVVPKWHWPQWFQILSA